jgi:ABC transporter substrate binding protein
MKRRAFITLLGGAAAAWPLAARAQQPGKLPTIGFLGATTPAAQSQLTAVFVQRLRELGWIEGQTVTIEYRWAEGRSERFAEFAAEFVRLKVDVILTHNTPPVLAAKQATSIIPIVFATAADPVDTGVVASLARPGGNVTGLSSQTPDVAGKRICCKPPRILLGSRGDQGLGIEVVVPGRGQAAAFGASPGEPSHQWRRPTNAWRKVTSPARRPKLPLGGARHG